MTSKLSDSIQQAKRERNIVMDSRNNTHKGPGKEEHVEYVECGQTCESKPHERNADYI